MKKKLAVILLAVLCVCALAGCKKSEIQGDWKDDQNNVYSFTKDMHFSIDIGDSVATGGTFAIDEVNHTIVFTITVPQGGTTVTDASYVLDSKAGTLTFTGKDGATQVLHK